MKILVPLDGSPLGEKALPTAITLGRKWSAELMTVRVINPFVGAPAGTAELALRFNDQEKEAASEYLESLSRRVEKSVIVPHDGSAVLRQRQQEFEKAVG